MSVENINANTKIANKINKFFENEQKIQTNKAKKISLFVLNLFFLSIPYFFINLRNHFLFKKVQKNVQILESINKEHVQKTVNRILQIKSSNDFNDIFFSLNDLSKGEKNYLNYLSVKILKRIINEILPTIINPPEELLKKLFERINKITIKSLNPKEINQLISTFNSLSEENKQKLSTDLLHQIAEQKFDLLSKENQVLILKLIIEKQGLSHKIPTSEDVSMTYNQEQLQREISNGYILTIDNNEIINAESNNSAEMTDEGKNILIGKFETKAPEDIRPYLQAVFSTEAFKLLQKLIRSNNPDPMTSPFNVKNIQGIPASNFEVTTQNSGDNTYYEITAKNTFAITETDNGSELFRVTVKTQIDTRTPNEKQISFEIVNNIPNTTQ